MRSLLLFFLIYLLPSILSIIPSFFIVFNIGLVFMVLLLTGSHLISPHVLKQSPSKIPLHLSQIFLVVYLKVPSLAHFFSLFIQLLLALSDERLLIWMKIYPIISDIRCICIYHIISNIPIKLHKNYIHEFLEQYNVNEVLKYYKFAKNRKLLTITFNNT